ncbi:hypothetical protein ZWY2020_024897 [Hordeum vulgare]|nr:hypothetical protein ZWY2020_024897 [Hordeum vulgare]
MSHEPKGGRASAGSLKSEERVRRAVAVSRERLAYTQQRRRLRASDDVSAPVHLATRQYIAEYLIGEPPQRAAALIDTGNNLICIQCGTACGLEACAKQDLPYYNLSRSSSFAAVPCRARTAASYALPTACIFVPWTAAALSSAAMAPAASSGRSARGLHLPFRRGDAGLRVREPNAEHEGRPERCVQAHRARPRPHVAHLLHDRHNGLLLPPPTSATGASSHLFRSACTLNKLRVYDGFMRAAALSHVNSNGG